MSDTKYLAGRHQAVGILESCNVAFWMDGTCNQTRDHHVKNIHTKFAELAKVLGYRIEKIEERTCQITGFKYDTVVEEAVPHA